MNLEEFLSLDDKLDITIWQVENDEESYTYRSSILDIQTGQILVYFPPESSDAFDWVQQGETLRIVLTRSNGLWSFFPTIGQFVLKGTARFWLNLPDDVEHLQRRKHVRVQHSFPLQLKQVEENALPAPAGGVPATAIIAPITVLQSVDISAGGARFKTSAPLPAGQLVQAKFKLSPALGEITNLARVVYCFSPEEMPATSAFAPKASVNAKKEYIAAIQFVDLPKDVEKRIIQECFHLELEQHRKGVR